MNKRVQILGALVFSMFAFGCVGPRYVAASTGSKGQVKFLHINGSGQQGVIKCDMADDGDLSNCRDIPINLEKGK
jgi:hypothetical protein